MAKSAKQADVEFTERDVKKFISDILEHHANIESAKGAYMRQARSERDGMNSIYEGMAARGLAQKIAKTEIKIIQLIEQVKRLTAEMDADQRKMLEKVARMQGDKKQLSLLLEVPKPVRVKAEKKPKPEKAPKADKPNNVVQMPQSDAPSAA